MKNLSFSNVNKIGFDGTLHKDVRVIRGYIFYTKLIIEINYQRSSSGSLLLSNIKLIPISLITSILLLSLSTNNKSFTSNQTPIKLPRSLPINIPKSQLHFQNLLDSWLDTQKHSLPTNDPIPSLYLSNHIKLPQIRKDIKPSNSSLNHLLSDHINSDRLVAQNKSIALSFDTNSIPEDPLQMVNNFQVQTLEQIQNDNLTILVKHDFLKESPITHYILIKWKNKILKIFRVISARHPSWFWLKSAWQSEHCW